MVAGIDHKYPESRDHYGNSIALVRNDDMFLPEGPFHQYAQKKRKTDKRKVGVAIGSHHYPRPEQGQGGPHGHGEE